MNEAQEAANLYSNAIGIGIAIIFVAVFIRGIANYIMRKKFMDELTVNPRAATRPSKLYIILGFVTLFVITIFGLVWAFSFKFAENL